MQKSSYLIGGSSDGEVWLARNAVGTLRVGKVKTSGARELLKFVCKSPAEHLRRSPVNRTTAPGALSVGRCRKKWIQGDGPAVRGNVPEFRYSAPATRCRSPEALATLRSDIAVDRSRVAHLADAHVSVNGFQATMRGGLGQQVLLQDSTDLLHWSTLADFRLYPTNAWYEDRHPAPLPSGSTASRRNKISPAF